MRLLDNWIQTYMQYTSYNEAPKTFHFWSAVSTIAAVLRRRVYFDQEFFVWTPNFYIIFVAPAGIATKSVSISVGEKMLDEIPGIRMGPNALTWQALPVALAEAAEGVEINGEIHTMSCLTFCSSELGVLFDPEDRKMIDVLVEFWDGKTGAWKKLTKHVGGEEVINPWVNIIAATTPTWLSDNLPKTMIDGGFMSRCIFVYADTKEKLVPYPKGSIPKEARELRAKLVQDLMHISELKGEFDMTPEAFEFGIKWYKEHYENLRSSLEVTQQFGGYMTRKQGHLHKLAMVLSVSRNDSLVIEERDLRDALAMLEVVERGLPHVFYKMNTVEEQTVTIEILAYVRKVKRIRESNLYRYFFARLTYDDFKKAINGLIGAGHLKSVQSNDGLIYLEITSAEPEKGD